MYVQKKTKQITILFVLKKERIAIFSFKKKKYIKYDKRK